MLSVVGGQPSLGRYCAFGELYATAQAGGQVHRIDRHPTMSRHPVTPMHEADLRRHLHSLGMGHVGMIDLRALDASADDPDALEASVRQAFAADPEALLFDALHEQHLRSVGAWLWRRAALRPQLVLGASSVAQAALAHWPDASRAALDSCRVAAAGSPVFVLVGSLSPVTAAQVQHAGALYESVPIDSARLLGDGVALDALARVCAAALARGRSVMARTAPPTDDGPASLDVARSCAELLARVLALSPQLRRIGVAGGDTSSLALRALGASALAWSGHLAPGVALTRVHAESATLDGLELMLKGGQMGPPDLFLRLLHGTP